MEYRFRVQQYQFKRSQTSWENAVGKPNRNQPKYTTNYVGDNRIGNIGCKFLTNATWPNLQSIVLCNGRLI